jgi:urease accessory protein
MIIVREPMEEGSSGEAATALRVSRETLAKRRWRGVADDGAEFGFDLETPLGDGAVIHRSEDAEYAIRQTPEAVLEVALPEAAGAARLGWMIGNLHFAVEVAGGVIRAVDDPALRQMFEREGIVFSQEVRVFRPLLAGGHSHH